MTTQQLMELVYRDVGEPTDLCPYVTPGDETTFDVTTAGAIKLLRYLNSGLTRVANWRFRDGRLLRLRGLACRRFFNVLDPPTGTAVSATASAIVIPGLAVNGDGQFDGWIIEIDGGTGSGQIRLVTGSTYAAPNVTCTVDEAWDEVPDATSTYSLYKSFFNFLSVANLSVDAYHIVLDPVNGLGDVMRVRDVTGLVDLTPTYFDDMFTASLKSTGTPGQYRVYGNQLWLDAAPTEARAYEILYVKQPLLLTSAGQAPDIPEPYHEAVALWATHNIQRMNQNFNGAYATKRELEDLMEMTRLQGSFESEHTPGGVVVWG